MADFVPDFDVVARCDGNGLFVIEVAAVLLVVILSEDRGELVGVGFLVS